MTLPSVPGPSQNDLGRELEEWISCDLWGRESGIIENVNLLCAPAGKWVACPNNMRILISLKKENIIHCV